MNPERYRQHLRNRLVYSNVPYHLHEGLVEYLVTRRPVGGFLTAVLSNDLTSACVKADPTSLARIADVVKFLVNFAPPSAWGSESIVASWLQAAPAPVPELYE